MRLAKSLLLASTILATTALPSKADINVVASIKPVHSLVAAVMQGVGEPGLIVKGAGSPHTYSLRPSEAAMMQDADVIFWVGHDLEPFLEKPLESISANAKTVELLDAHGLVKLGFREGGAFDKHDHGDEHAHDDHDHDDHAHDDHAHDDDHDHDHGAKPEAGHDHDHDHDHEAKAEHDHDHDHDHEAKAEHDHDHDHDDHADAKHAGHDDHDHGEFDPHIWLDPINAKAMVHEIEEALVEADPDNAAIYEANAEKVNARLNTLIGEVEGDLTNLSDKGFIVFHDAYQYFEARFGLEASGSITVSPEVMPGAERVGELRDKVKNAGVTCVFSEPQFEPKLVSTVTEGTQAKAGVLDPLGADVENGPDHYFMLIRNLAASFKTCLGGES